MNGRRNWGKIAEPRVKPVAQGHHRVIFIDLARAMAVVMMVYGHTVSALLAPEYRTGAWFDLWIFQRSLTSSLFLLLSGFAFSIATTRHWASHTRLTPGVLKRARRFALFILLGYALHFPVRHFADLAYASEERWRSFFVVDVLQLIGVTFLFIQLLVLTVKSRRVFMVVSFVLALAIIYAAPWAWSRDWTASMPDVLAAYLSPSTGSQFPLVPWAGYVLMGAAAGQVYARWGAADLKRFANRALLIPGLVILPLTWNRGWEGPLARFGAGDSNWVPGEVIFRAGACFVILALMAHASQRIARLPHLFGAVAQESLLVYFVHLCIVYGSIWNVGLTRYYGESLSLPATVGVVVVIEAAMVLLAWQWNRLKHHRPRTARWISFAVGALLVGYLV